MMITNKPIPQEKIEKRECKFVLSLGNKHTKDLHLIKEQLTLNDGEVLKRVVLLEDFKKPIYITKTNKQNHKTKKERERIENTDIYKVTRLNQTDIVARAIGKGYLTTGNPIEIYKSPYVYGTDFSHCAYIKYLYMKKNPDFTPFSVAVFDIETNVFSENQETIIATLSFKDKVITAIVKDYVEGISDVERQLREKFHYYLDPFIKDRVKKWEIIISDTPAKAIIDVFKRAHRLSPDFIAIWNIDFDIPKIVMDLKREGYKPEDIFSDPIVPPSCRHFEYIQGPAVKTTNRGVIQPLKPAQRWHWVDTPASFYFVDAMQVYYRVRMAQQDEPSYSLDAILDKELGIRKLKFSEADQYKGLNWHKYLQKNYKLEYIIYNVFDCISVELLDEKTYDLSIAMPSSNHCSHFKDYKSEPKRLWDKLYGFLLERGYVAGTAQGIQSDIDSLQIGKDDWINTLPAHMLQLKKSPFYEETSNLYTKIRTHCGDLDISAAYPSNGVASNASRETTAKELIEIQGVSDQVRRSAGINLSGGNTNAIEVMTDLFNVPTLFELDKYFIKKQL